MAVWWQVTCGEHVVSMWCHVERETVPATLFYQMRHSCTFEHVSGSFRGRPIFGTPGIGRLSLIRLGFIADFSCFAPHTQNLRVQNMTMRPTD